jgi:hypothetical protein
MPAERTEKSHGENHVAFVKIDAVFCGLASGRSFAVPGKEFPAEGAKIPCYFLTEKGLTP